MKKVIKYFLVTLLVCCIVGTIWVYYNKDEIIQHFVNEVNKELTTKISVGKIDISVLEQLPYLSVRLHNVTVQESFPSSNKSLLVAEKISCALNIFSIIQGDYTIKAITLVNTQISPKVNENNRPNYQIFKKKKENDQASFLDLSSITLKNAEISYANKYTDMQLSLVTEILSSSLQIYGKVYHFQVDGAMNIGTLTSKNQSYAKDKIISLDAEILYNLHQKSIEAYPSLLEYKGSEFDFSGKYLLTDSHLILSLSCENTRMSTLREMIPERYQRKLRGYQYSGNISFETKIDGAIGSGKLPPTHLQFGLKNGAITYSKKSIAIEALSLNGFYQNHPNDSLSLTNIEGQIDKNSFNSTLKLTDFGSPTIDWSFDGKVSAKSLASLYNFSSIDTVSGDLEMDFRVLGRLNDFKNRSTIQNVKMSGEVSIDNLSIGFSNNILRVKQLNGNFIFHNNDLAISSLSGKYGNSDFDITGRAKNFLAYTTLDNQPIGIEADMRSSYIDLNELLAKGNNSTDSYYFSISPKLFLKLNCDIDQLIFRRFIGKQIKGDLKVKHQQAVTNQISFSTMGGKINLSGSLDARTQEIAINTHTTFENIHIDSIFYTFENFGQNFLTSSHLKGQINSDVTCQMVVNPQLKTDYSSLVADISTTIIGGQLNNFEPMQRLSKYIDGEALDNLRFAELTNDIHIENKIIYLPQMQVNSNATNILIGGTHTFDKKINYDVVVPLVNRKKIDKDTSFGQVEDPKVGKSKLFLNITGTTNDYVIRYDKSAVKNKIISDLKKEVQELKNAFRNKGVKKKKETVELEEEDYFDF